jgi:hypothetical protein
MAPGASLGSKDVVQTGHQASKASGSWGMGMGSSIRMNFASTCVL